jgi:hypothetical protein
MGVTQINNPNRGVGMPTKYNKYHLCFKIVSGEQAGQKAYVKQKAISLEKAIEAIKKEYDVEDIKEVISK